ncbi:MAG: diacylglycerol kinase family lipid kinase [Saprospiraceae bacterium]|nr:diacylglycerol kinase family lipid kinase [Saprospiraceae bacterium]
MKNNNEIWYCVMNPTAGKRDHTKVWKEIQDKLVEQHVKYEVYFTKAKKDAESFVIGKVEDGYRKFIAIGGDGTVHEIVNGIMKQEVVASNQLTLAVIPVGTGNDWAKHHNITFDLDKLCASLKQEKTDVQDMGLASFSKNGDYKLEYFNNVAGMAYDAFVVEQLEKRTGKPNKLIYIFSVLSLLFKYKLQKASVKFDNSEKTGKFYTINVGICKYSGGGMSMVPHALHSDGLLALTLAGQLKKIDVLLNTYRFYNESLLQHPKIDSYQVKELEVTSMDDNPIALELDGEMAGHNPVRFTIVEKGLRFVKM